jgi:hypothetical protein
MSSYCCEDDVIAWAKEIGFRPGDASLSRNAVSKLCRGSRDFWEFTIRNIHRADEVQRLRGILAKELKNKDSAKSFEDTRLASIMSSRKAIIPRVRENNATLQSMHDIHLVRTVAFPGGVSHLIV